MIKLRIRKNFAKVIYRIDKVRPNFFIGAEPSFVAPLKKSVFEIKKRLKGTRDFNHMFTGKLYKSVKASLISASYREDGVSKITLEIGYFGAPHGLFLEKGEGPKKVDFKKIYSWATNKLRRKGKYKKAEARKFALAVMNKLRRVGSRAYPIVTTVIEDNKQKYFEESTKKFFEKLFR